MRPVRLRAKAGQHFAARLTPETDALHVVPARGDRVSSPGLACPANGRTLGVGRAPATPGCGAGPAAATPGRAWAGAAESTPGSRSGEAEATPGSVLVCLSICSWVRVLAPSSSSASSSSSSPVGVDVGVGMVVVAVGVGVVGVPCSTTAPVGIGVAVSVGVAVESVPVRVTVLGAPVVVGATVPGVPVVVGVTVPLVGVMVAGVPVTVTVLVVGGVNGGGVGSGPDTASARHTQRRQAWLHIGGDSHSATGRRPARKGAATDSPRGQSALSDPRLTAITGGIPPCGPRHQRRVQHGIRSPDFWTSLCSHPSTTLHWFTRPNAITRQQSDGCGVLARSPAGWGYPVFIIGG